MNLFPLVLPMLTRLQLDSELLPTSSNESGLSEDQRLKTFLIWCSIQKYTSLSTISIGKSTQRIAPDEPPTKFVENTSSPDIFKSFIQPNRSDEATDLCSPAACRLLRLAIPIQKWWPSFTISKAISIISPVHATQFVAATISINVSQQLNIYIYIYYREHICRGQWSFCCS